MEAFHYVVHRYLSLQQAALRSGVAHDTILRLAQDGSLRAVALGGRLGLRVSVADLDRLLAARERGS